MSFGPPLSEADVPLFDSAVVPRYLSFFASLSVQMLLPFAPARIAHLGCRVGYPHLELAERFPECEIIGSDVSEAAIELARSRTEGLEGATLTYEVGEGITHAMEPCARRCAGRAQRRESMEASWPLRCPHERPPMARRAHPHIALCVALSRRVNGRDGQARARAIDRCRPGVADRWRAWRAPGRADGRDHRRDSRCAQRADAVLNRRWGVAPI